MAKKTRLELINEAKARIDALIKGREEEKDQEETDTEAIKLATILKSTEESTEDVIKEIQKNAIKKEDLQKALNIQVTVPEVKVPEAKVDVKIPEIKLPKIEVPKITVPPIEVKIPKIVVPEPKVTVNVPPITIPEIKIPEAIIQLPEEMTVRTNRPLPVTLMDAAGKPYVAGGGGASGGGGIVKIGDGTNIAKVHKDGHIAIVDGHSGLAISQGEVEGTSFIHKFGATPDFDAGDGSVDVWDGASDGGIDEMQYNYSTTAAIDSVSTDEAGATQEVEVQGLDGDYKLKVQTVSLNGHERVNLPTSLIRTFRMKNVSVTDFASTVVAYENTALVDGIPADTTKIRAVVNNGNNQTLMALYTIPAGKTGYMRSFFAGSAGASRSTDYIIDLFARPFGQVFQLKHRSSLVETGTSHWNHIYSEPEKFTEKTDIAMRVRTTESPITAASVAAGFDLILIDN